MPPQSHLESSLSACKGDRGVSFLIVDALIDFLCLETFIGMKFCPSKYWKPTFTCIYALFLPLVALAQATDSALAQRVSDAERRVTSIEKNMDAVALEQRRMNQELLTSVSRMEGVGTALALILGGGQIGVVLLVRNGKKTKS